MPALQSYYNEYQSVILPILAEAQMRSNADYREYYSDISSIYTLIAASETANSLSAETTRQLDWLFLKVEIALYSCVVNDMAVRLKLFHRQTSGKGRCVAGINTEYEARYKQFNDKVCAYQKQYGSSPKIAQPCFLMLKDMYAQGVKLETEIASHVDRLRWLAPKARHWWISGTATWICGVAASVLVGLYYACAPASKVTGVDSAAAEPPQAECTNPE